MTTKPNDNPQFYISALKKDNAELTKQNYDLMKKYNGIRKYIAILPTVSLVNSYAMQNIGVREIWIVSN